MVASGDGDCTILLWEIAGRQPDGRWHAKALTPHQLDDCWSALAGADAARAYDAVWSLVAAPEQAVPFLRPVPRPDAAVARLLTDLGSDDFTVKTSNCPRAESDNSTARSKPGPRLVSALEWIGGEAKPTSVRSVRVRRITYLTC
jgi:hypothetical protein